MKKKANFIPFSKDFKNIGKFSVYTESEKQEIYLPRFYNIRVRFNKTSITIKYNEKNYNIRYYFDLRKNGEITQATIILKDNKYHKYEITA